MNGDDAVRTHSSTAVQEYRMLRSVASCGRLFPAVAEHQLNTQASKEGERDASLSLSLSLHPIRQGTISHIYTCTDEQKKNVRV